MVKPLHALLVRLKKLHVKVGKEDGKSQIDLHIRKAVPAHDTLAKLLRAMYRGPAVVAELKGTYLMPMHWRGPLENETFHRSSSLPFSPSQRSGLKEAGSGNRFGLSWIMRVLMETMVCVRKTESVRGNANVKQIQ